MSNLWKLAASIILPFMAGAIGSLFTFSAISTWYVTLNKPFFTPPNFVFGPVWTTLYLLMGISLYLAWRSKKSRKRDRGLQFFLVQLVFNALWSLVFFGAHAVGLALLVVVVLWLLILLTIRYFMEINKIAAYLLYPYLAWVAIATALNLGILILNP